MSQHDLIISNDSGAAVRADLNLALQALGSMMTGAVGSLSATYPNMLIADTTSGYVAKRNSTDTAWDYLMPIDQSIPASTEGSDSYAVSYSPAITSLKDGVVFPFRPDVENTTGATFKVNGLSPITLKKWVNGALVTLGNGDIAAGQICHVMYDNTAAAGILMQPSSPAVGQVAQVAYTITSTKTSGTTPIPCDDTIPQITEGDLILTLNFTPKKATNILQFDVILNCSKSGTTTPIIAALFNGATASAIAATFVSFPVTERIYPIVIKHFMVAGTASATDFTVRVGGPDGYHFVNGSWNATWMGGVMYSSITITEIEG